MASITDLAVLDDVESLVAMVCNNRGLASAPLKHDRAVFRVNDGLRVPPSAFLALMEGNAVVTNVQPFFRCFQVRTPVIRSR